MNIFRYMQRQLKRFKIDMLTQRTFLAGGVPSIDNNHIIKTDSTNYEELDIIFFQRMAIKPDDVIIDVGCGKGRVFNYLLYKGLRNKMVGYEINTEVGEVTKRRLSRFKNVEILSENIFDNFPKEGNIFYLYHPFKEVMMTEFMHRMLGIADRNPVMIYNNPVCIDIFDNPNFTYQVYEEPVKAYGYRFKFAIIKLK